MGVQACRLPGLKHLPLKPLKLCKLCKSRSERRTVQAIALPQGHTSLKHSLGMLHPAANRHPKATHQWLLMGVQACRLPALKSLKPLKPLKISKHLKPLQPVMGVQACRLPGLKRLPLKPLKPCKLCKSCSERRTVQAIALPQGHIA